MSIRLTVTKVVFEFILNWNKWYLFPGLTVTKVVFEFADVSELCFFVQKINSNKGCFWIIYKNINGNHYLKLTVTKVVFEFILVNYTT